MELALGVVVLIAVWLAVIFASEYFNRNVQ